MYRLIIVATLALVQLPPSAFAQEFRCSPSVTHEEVNDRLKYVEMALDPSSPNLDEAEERLAYIFEKNFPCMNSLVDPLYISRFARLQAHLNMYRQDETISLTWAHLAQNTDPTLVWASKFPESLIANTLQEERDLEGPPTLAGPSDVGLAPPPKGGIFLNGVLLTKPQAYTSIPGLIQVINKKQKIVATYWQDGGAFQEEWLGDIKEIKAPKWYDGPISAVANAPTALAKATPTTPTKAVVAPAKVVVTAKKPLPTKDLIANPPKEKKAKKAKKDTRKIMAISSVSMGVLSASLYGLAALNMPQYNDHSSMDDLNSSVSTTNFLVLGSGVMGVAAVGLSATLFVSNSPGIGFNFQY
jgi:hypothetical protein